MADRYRILMGRWIWPGKLHTPCQSVGEEIKLLLKSIRGTQRKYFATMSSGHIVIGQRAAELRQLRVFRSGDAYIRPLSRSRKKVSGIQENVVCWRNMMSKIGRCKEKTTCNTWTGRT